ncbi:thioredoxin-disulfide reductase [Breznakiella homolactica]|uniref:Thioredoxin reductase n=1 Tax=Breznakiella homolactica TaxID=2798577 RepID=A0A7T8B9U5_9SPIR|nr:thioredoxin-disulfide reductase [Breznakiella homolactica]QQO08852.1 thioredoxin-disulfide reductase [Breznakiella homolactica]
MKDVVIIGGGPAGLTAAIYAARAGMKVLVLEKMSYGGQVSLTAEVENYPGFKSIPGMEFSGNLYEHALAQNAEVAFEDVRQLKPRGEKKKIITAGKTYEAATIIAASGAARKKLECPGEAEYIGKGVSFCATCDAAFFRDKTVAIVGGGNTALGDALFLSNSSKKVYLIHRRNTFRAHLAVQRAVLKRKNIEILYNTTVESIAGGQFVEGCKIRTPQGTKDLPVDGIFVAIGMKPETELLKGLVKLDRYGYVLTDERCATAIPGLYVAGDIRKKPLRQIVTAAADGAVAAVAASEYVTIRQERLKFIHHLE